ncbi:transcriptional activator protein-like protein acu-15 [Patellaria atrata CBS 101060]|uniref:Transcriptional activator protein-like protein acu-15 n=1 Tax=Patellaria atrata CBS 101060 TaxID=1346257 RepID=A0A9P4S9A8_9PEZI|nr:transcriptional activator protein-like protein acu-15 [Patellaria atrata CBS 101060]
MPGILPMKVIKVGSSAQARIAQACDRCRSKKIRCDGIRPSCTQCANVGFECKTSDKLSRRAFPRGYTESLEERVRCLESEVRELKELLDEKDEKIDMLSRIHSHSPQPFSSRKPSATSIPASNEGNDDIQDKDDVFKVQQSPLLLDDENADSYFVGTSNGRTLVDSFKARLQEMGKPCSDIVTDTFFATESHGIKSPNTLQKRIVTFKAPPRLVSDQMINIFFQEWAPIFPVLHRPTFLALYEDYVANPEAPFDKKSVAQLNLVFGIAALSANSRNPEEVESFEMQWQAALESFIFDNSLATLQCLILAEIYCLQKADYTKLLKYKGLAVSLAHRLGLHQSQKRFALGALSSESRKKVFWSLYTLDCFSAAQLGLPKQFKEEDIHCEYPVDADDEYVSEKGFLPTLPGETTKLSSALALFRISRILAKVLDELYPASTAHEISFRKIAALSDELSAWSKGLAPHLRLQFVQDKPSTNTISSRSPILSLAYQYVRSLIHRPAVCAGLGDRSSASVVALADTSKHIVQILELLEERSLSFSFCLSKHELLVLAGFGLLFQSLKLDRDGKLIKDNQKLVSSILSILERDSSYCANEFYRVSQTVLATPKSQPSPMLSQQQSDSAMPAPQDPFRATPKQLKAIASRLIKQSGKPQQDLKEPRRATLPHISPNGITQHRNPSQTSISSHHSEPPFRPDSSVSPFGNRASLAVPSNAQQPNKQKRSSTNHQLPNLDYLSFGTDYSNPLGTTYLYSPQPPVKPEVSNGDWERLLGSIDNGQNNIYDTIYGGAPVEAVLDVPPMSASADVNLVWPQALWNLSLDSQPPQSVLSFSDESLTSGGEEYGVSDFTSSAGSVPPQETYRGIMIPDLSPRSGVGLDFNGLDGGFGL